MEAGRSFLSPSPPNLSKTQLRNPLFSTKVLMLQDQARLLITSIPSISIVRQFPASVLPHESHRDDKTNVLNEENILQKGGLPLCKEKEKQDFDQYLKNFERRLVYQPGFWYLFPASFTEEKRFLITETESIVSEINVGNDLMKREQNSPSSMKPEDVLALAKRAAVASKDAALLAEESDVLATEYSQARRHSFDLNGFADEILMKEKPTVRSKRLLERQTKKRKVSKKPNNVVSVIPRAVTTDISKKIKKDLNTDDRLRLFLWGPETTQLLTIKEEKDLFSCIQELRRLEEVKQRLQMQFNREPRLAEWAEAVGMSCQVLCSCLSSGNRSREKMIYSNFRLVIHIAKQYEGKGLNIQDLLQEGSKGLMKSLEKFEPKAGCRFSTYAYWWIRQSIRKSIFQNSRTIRLPENVFALLKKVQTAKRLCSQEGHLPTNEELAKCVGIRVGKLESLLMNSRTPLSIQNHVWADQDATFQEITADPEVEVPDVIFAKRMMRQHVCNLLGVLNPRDRQIIKFRYGISSERKSLSEIGAIYGLSKERVRQLESRAMDKLKACLPSQGLDAYTDMLV